MTTPVRPQLARLLKEKGCEIATTDLYIDNELIYAEGRICNWNLEPEYEELENPISAPTIAEVLMWLYEKHKLFIHLSYVCWSHLNEDAFTPHIAKVLSDNGQSDAIRIMLANCDSPTEAYEAAIEYCLTNLI